MKLRLYAPGHQNKYPHIYGPDKLLVDSFWTYNTIKFNSVAYDVPIGGFFDFQKVNIDKINTDWEYLASFKIDMIGFQDDTIWITEFKHNSKPEGIGQLLVYQHLFEKHPLAIKNLKLLFVSYNMKTVIEDVCKKFGIDTFSIWNYNII